MKPEARNGPMLGSVLEGRYRLVSRLGRGGMGSVDVAEKTRFGRPHALKSLNPEPADEPAITVQDAIGSDGAVLRAEASQNGPFDACLADAVKQARFEPRIRRRQEIAL